MNRTFRRKVSLFVLVAALTAVSLVLAGCGPKVPDVVGMRQADAVRALQEAGYKLGEVSAIATTSVEVGLIAAQDPAAGERLKEGKAISLSVNFSNGVDAVVPSVVGLQEAAAVNVAESTGFVPLVVEQYVSLAAKGVVAAQVPDAQSSVTSGSTLVMVVSLGTAPETASVPDVVGKTKADAESAIKKAGFTSKAVEVYDSSVAKGSVITQLPAAGTSAVKGSTVQIVVSLGPGTGATTVPNVVGKAEADAVATLGSAGLAASVLRQYNDTVAPGVVAQQFPAPNSTAAAGSQVAVVVSLGKQPASSVSVPEVTGMTQEEAVAVLEGLGLAADVQMATSTTVPKGTVSYQYPGATAAVLPGSSVLVVVSSGK